MARKRLTLLALPAAAALAVVGVAVAAGHGPSAQAASATFDATTVSNIHAVTCSVNGGDTYQLTTAKYAGTATSTDVRLDGKLTITAHSLVDTTTGVGHLTGVYKIVGANKNGARGRIDAAISGTQATGIATGSVHRPGGRLIASLGATFGPTTGFVAASLGTGAQTGAGVVVGNGTCRATHKPHKSPKH